MVQRRPAQPDLESYLRLFEPYREQLQRFVDREGDFGNRFALLFRQVVRALRQESPFNATIPQPFHLVASKYLAKEQDVVRHFSYEENRHFFLSDLYDWLRIQERGHRMREMGSKG